MMLSFLLFILINAVAEPSHGYSVTGLLKYNANFTHFSFVNPDSPKGGELIIGEVGTFQNLNSFVSHDKNNGRMLGLEYASLLFRSYEEPLSAYCWCAKSIDIVGDGRGVIFELRKNIEWDQGFGEFTADDVVFSLKAWKSEGSLFSRNLYAPVSSVVKIDRYTFKVIFSSSNPTLPIIIGGMPILCKKYYEKYGLQALHTKPMLSLGPYRITEHKFGAYICYEKKKNYWGASLPCSKGLYNFDKVIVRYYPDSVMMRLACRKGEIQSFIESDPIHIAHNKGYPKSVKQYSWRTQRPPQISLLFFNLRKPFFQDWNVRRAFALLFRYDLLQKFCFQNLHKPLNSLFVNTLCESDASLNEEALMLIAKHSKSCPEIDAALSLSHINDYDKRVEKACHLLKNAGWTFDVKRKTLCNAAGEIFPVLQIFCANRSQYTIALDFKRRLAAIGVTLKVSFVDSPFLQHVLMSHSLYDFAFYSYVGTHYPGLGLKSVMHSSFVNSKRGRNYAGMNHKAIDVLLDEISAVSTVQEQKKLVKLIDRVVLIESFCIPLFYGEVTTFLCWDDIAFPPFVPEAGYVLMSAYKNKN